MSTNCSESLTVHDNVYALTRKLKTGEVPHLRLHVSTCSFFVGEAQPEKLPPHDHGLDKSRQVGPQCITIHPYDQMAHQLTNKLHL